MFEAKEDRAEVAVVGSGRSANGSNGISVIVSRSSSRSSKAENKSVVVIE
jgi:hypothetical protein